MTQKNTKIEDVYKKLTQNEHVLKRPGMYVGSIEPITKSMYVCDGKYDNIIKRDITYVPAFVKLFDEILTNASDHAIRTNGKVKNINVKIADDLSVISIMNDGPGIPIEKHATEGIYVPELIFGHMLSGSNFDDTEERFVGGMNGMGSVLVNLFSTRFIVETSDGKKYYTQEFRNNMSIVGTPIITDKSVKEHTCITYYPDLTRLPVPILKDTIALMVKRCLDVAAYNLNVNITVNGIKLDVKTLKDYIRLHNDNEEIFTDTIDNNWTIAVTGSNTDNFENISIVNGITTYTGGTHVNAITEQLIEAIKQKLTKGNKKLKVRNADIKSKLMCFIICKLPNPVFDTQSKENLISKITNKPILSEKIIKSICNSSIIESIREWIELKEQAELGKLTKQKGSRIRVKKLDDAFKAGTSESAKCTLFLSEGDSARATVISGFSTVNRDYYGVFPLKGKPLNVRDQVLSKIRENDEISNIITALGLVIGNKCTISDLRYGKLVLMSDADSDGVHIKGLLINFIEKYWPNLLQEEFLYEFITPVIRARKVKEVVDFYNIDDYRRWESSNDISKYKIKYYKGLGTIQADEIKDMFKNMSQHLIKFKYVEGTNESVDLAFNKKKADKRKEWLLNYKGEIIPDKLGKDNTYTDFFDKEFIQFSMYDNVRSIPHMMDGLKPSQRKILYTCLKRNITDEVKVAQLSGSVAELTHYAHGEMSLNQAIVDMAQDFVGSNNIPLILPIGQFGTRLQGGEDSASPRYIYTRLNELTRYIFRKEDDDILNIQVQEGYIIEPEYYVPIVPMVLVNGTTGIGTGWSTDIPKFNIQQIIKILEFKLNGDNQPRRIKPYYENFLGDINYINKKFESTGKASVKGTQIHITELPVGMWTDKYCEILDALVDNKTIKDYKNNSTDIIVNIIISATREFCSGPDLLGKLKLKTSLPTTNMNLWYDGKITRYDMVESIIDTFYNDRLVWYERRKEFILMKYKIEGLRLLNTYKFITLVNNGTLKVSNRKKHEIVTDLIANGILTLATIESGGKPQIEGVESNGYDYLLNMPIYSLTSERALKLKEQLENKKQQIIKLKDTAVNQLWLDDLNELKSKL